MAGTSEDGSRAMTDGVKRGLLYSAAGIAIAVLVLCARYEAEADFGTLIGAASVHAELAQSIPADTDNDEGRALRTRLLDEAEQWVARAEAVTPQTSVACEVRAFIAGLRGDHARSARLYGTASQLPDCPAEHRGALILNQARELSNAGSYGEALDLLARQKGAVAADPTAAERVWIHVLARAGRVPEARQRARRLAEAADGKSGSELFAAAALSEELEDWSAAEAAYRRATDDPARANYYLARLKIRVGQIDRALEMLERAVESSRPTVLRLLEQDQDAWRGCAETIRFRQLTDPEGEASSPGR